jgi:uncharacterized protein (UPF0305 family)
MLQKITHLSPENWDKQTKASKFINISQQQTVYVFFLRHTPVSLSSASLPSALTLIGCASLHVCALALSAHRFHPCAMSIAFLSGHL